ncbi:MAG TPA: hypothetical protein PKD00_07015 [Burkholderiales bacterium]|nr:hypothetical protein [Burkholderiales bacterium]
MCRILRNDNEELVGVLAPNGAPSNLFRSITEHVTDLNEAVKMYKSINTVSSNIPSTMQSMVYQRLGVDSDQTSAKLKNIEELIAFISDKFPNITLTTEDKELLKKYLAINDTIINKYNSLTSFFTIRKLSGYDESKIFGLSGIKEDTDAAKYYKILDITYLNKQFDKLEFLYVKKFVAENNIGDVFFNLHNIVNSVGAFIPDAYHFQEYELPKLLDVSFAYPNVVQDNSGNWAADLSPSDSREYASFEALSRMSRSTFKQVHEYIWKMRMSDKFKGAVENLTAFDTTVSELKALLNNRDIVTLLTPDIEKTFKEFSKFVTGDVIENNNVSVQQAELLLAQFSNSRLEKTTEGLETFFNSALDNNEEIKWEYLDDKFTSTPKADSQPWVDSDVIDKLLDNGYLNCE